MRNSADKQDRTVATVSNHEKERMVGTKDGGPSFGNLTEAVPLVITTPVAAAASVPSSLTSTKALWIVARGATNAAMVAKTKPRPYASESMRASVVHTDADSSKPLRAWV